MAKGELPSGPEERSQFVYPEFEQSAETLRRISTASFITDAERQVRVPETIAYLRELNQRAREFEIANSLSLTSQKTSLSESIQKRKWRNLFSREKTQATKHEFDPYFGINVKQLGHRPSAESFNEWTVRLAGDPPPGIQYREVDKTSKCFEKLPYRENILNGFPDITAPYDGRYRPVGIGFASYSDTRGISIPVVVVLNYNKDNRSITEVKEVYEFGFGPDEDTQSVRFSLETKRKTYEQRKHVIEVRRLPNPECLSWVYLRPEVH